MKTTPMPTIYDRNYRKLLQLIPHLADLQVGHYLRFEAGKAFMPLSVDTLDREETRLCIALSHHFEQNGDLVADPDMELRVDLEDQTVEAGGPAVAGHGLGSTKDPWVSPIGVSLSRCRWVARRVGAHSI